MSELTSRLRVMARLETVQSEFNTEEHAAWKAADLIEQLEAEVLYDAAFIKATDDDNKRLKARLEEIGMICEPRGPVPPPKKEKRIVYECTVKTD